MSAPEEPRATEGATTCGGRGWIPCPVNSEDGCFACRNRGAWHECKGCCDCEDITETLERGGFAVAFDTGRTEQEVNDG